MSLTDQFLAAIDDSGLTLYRIAKDAGLPYPVVHRFATGEREIRLSTADKLAKLFEMRLTRPKRIKPPKRR